MNIFTFNYVTPSFAKVDVNVWIWATFDINQCLESENCKRSVNNIFSLDQINWMITEFIQQTIYKFQYGSYADDNKWYKAFKSSYWGWFDLLEKQNKKIDNIVLAFNSYFNVNRDIYNKNNKNKYWNLKADYEKEQKDFCDKINGDDKKWLYRKQEKFLKDYIRISRDDNSVEITSNMSSLFNSKFNDIVKYDDRKFKFCWYDFSNFYTWTQQYQILNTKLINITKVINANENYKKSPTKKNWEILQNIAEQYKKMYWATNDIYKDYSDLTTQVNDSKTRFQNIMKQF